MKAYEDARNKAINITASFEGTGYTGLTGSFDGMGWTYGIFGFNLGQGSLQKLLKAFYDRDSAKFRELSKVYVGAYKKTTDLAPVLLEVAAMGTAEAVTWAKGRQDKNHVVASHWRAVFTAFGNYEPFREVQRDYAKNAVNKARGYCLKYGLRTERALALFFDCVIQQGGMTAATQARIDKKNLSKLEYYAKLGAIAECMALQAREQYHDDVYSRRICIARGKGIVHGRTYDLGKEFGLKDAIVVTP